MQIQGIEKVSMVDYPNKIATTIFAGGCNFRCPFCHNSGIVEKKYDNILEEDVLQYLESRKGLIDAVVVSGGEPTLQPDLDKFISKLKEMNFLVKLDSNGTNPFVLKKLLDSKLLDYVAIDIKTNFDDYSAITGVKNPNTSNIKETVEILRNSGISYELRTTLINEFHAEENIKKMADELAGEKVLYLQKFVASENCIQKDLTEVPKMKAIYFANILSQKIERVILRGY